jgi:hypothetical protein
MSNHSGSKAGGADRRAFLTAAGALPAAALLSGIAGLPARAASANVVAGFDPNLVPTPTVLGGWLKQLHDFGPIRFTGTPECRSFEEWLATQFGDLGCQIERDQFKLMSWRCRIEDCSITVREDGGRERKLDVVAYYPFSATTRGKPSVTGRVLFAGVGDDAGKALAARTPPDVLAQSIVVLHMPIGGQGPDRVTQYFPESFPSPLPKTAAAPDAGGAAFQAQPSMEALDGKCRGIVFCYTDVTNDAARYNFLPFTDKHRGTSALWVGAEDARYLQQVSGKATATLRCDAELTPNARADTIVATLKGASDEVVLMTTQTDGPNECNENGALGLLAAATYLSKVKDRRRTFVFSLPTGHYASGPVRDPVTGSGRRAGTAGVLAKWPHLTERMVAQIAMEQLAASEWVDVNGEWQATGRPAIQHWIPTPATAAPINRLFMAATAGEDSQFARAALVSGNFPGGGEGGVLRGAGIPGIGLMGTPHYFFRADPKGVLDKLDPRIMHLEVSLAIKLLVLFDRLTPAQLKGQTPISDHEIHG